MNFLLRWGGFGVVTEEVVTVIFTRLREYQLFSTLDSKAEQSRVTRSQAQQLLLTATPTKKKQPEEPPREEKIGPTTAPRPRYTMEAADRDHMFELLDGLRFQMAQQATTLATQATALATKASSQATLRTELLAPVKDNVVNG
jgi:hypothetical protein